MFEGLDWGSILSIVFGLLTTVASVFWLKAKGKLGKIKTAAKESFDLIKVAIEAVDDDKITAEERVSIKKEAKEAWAAIKAVVEK